MKTHFFKLVVNFVSLITVIYIMPGIAADDWFSALVALIVLTLINAFLRPVIMILTLPINILSFGVLTFFINGFLFYLMSNLVEGFSVDGFLIALFGSLLYSIVSIILNLMLNPSTKFSYYYKGVKRNNAQNYSQNSASHEESNIIEVTPIEEKKQLESSGGSIK